MRLAGAAAGVFVMVEMLIFQSFVKLIPQAVFTGVLLKVGYGKHNTKHCTKLRQPCISNSTTSKTSSTSNRSLSTPNGSSRLR